MTQMRTEIGEVLASIEDADLEVFRKRSGRRMKAAGEFEARFPGTGKPDLECTGWSLGRGPTQATLRIAGELQNSDSGTP
jgi:hypothetical protein